MKSSLIRTVAVRHTWLMTMICYQKRSAGMKSVNILKVQANRCNKTVAELLEASSTWLGCHKLVLAREKSR